MDRTFHQLLLRDHFPQNKMAFLVGPRQVGKTTLAELLLHKRRSGGFYRNWDDLEWRRTVSRSPYGFLDQFRPKQSLLKPLLVLDEIHKFPRWKAYLKGLWDTHKQDWDVLVTGSGRLDVYQRGGDSLLGRYHQYRFHPLSLREVLNPKPPPKNYKPEDTLHTWLHLTGQTPKLFLQKFNRLLSWGGFPASYLAQNENQHRLWINERRRLLLREDLRDLSRIQLISHVEELVELLVLRAGGVLSYNALREDLQVALDSVRLWVDYLKRLFFIYLLKPFSKNIARSLRREPKFYLWDWSEIQEPGIRFENMVASHLLKWCHFTQDWGYAPLELHYVRDKEKREVDFLITKEKKPWLLIEAKQSDVNPSSALHYFADCLEVKHKIQVVANLQQTGKTGDTLVLSAASFLAELPV